VHPILEAVARKLPGGKFPSDYWVLDTETTGADPYTARVVQVGIAIVKGGEIVNSAAKPIRLPRDVKIEPEAQAVHGWTWEMLDKDGYLAAEVFGKLGRSLEAVKPLVVGHNFCAFDRVILQREMSAIGVPFVFNADRMIDTGMLFKAIYADIPDVGPWPKESLLHYFDRISRLRLKGVLWSMNYCRTALRLRTKFGLLLEDNESVHHDAAHDCILTHYVLKALMESNA